MKLSKRMSCMSGFLILVTVLFFSCKPNLRKEQTLKVVTDTATVKTEAIATGYTPSLAGTQNPAHAYSVYVPTAYTERKSWPVIFIFDAHARGKLPVTMYKELAESFGYILFASNNSRNGQDMETAASLFLEMKNEVVSRLNIDTRRMYTMGFSGGSRVAANLAISQGGLAGVIGCSAGFQLNNQVIPNTLSFIGIAGNEDFNLAEMKDLDQGLNQTGLRHQLLIFNGKHEWCPVETMREAFYWITINAMRNQLIPGNDSLYRAFLGSQEILLGKLKKEGNAYEIFKINEKIVNYLDGLTDINVYREHLNQLKNSDKVLAYGSYLNRIAAEETRLQKQYAGFITTRDLPWWKAEVGQLQQAISRDQKREEALFKKRLLSYMSLLAYMYSNQALTAGDLDMASRFIKIYETVDPENPEHAYMNALLMMQYKNPALAIKALKRAVELGFNDRERMLQEQAFSSLMALPEMKAVADSMH